jgi:hypothetical protein
MIKSNNDNAQQSSVEAQQFDDSSNGPSSLADLLPSDLPDLGGADLPDIGADFPMPDPSADLPPLSDLSVPPASGLLGGDSSSSSSVAGSPIDVAAVAQDSLPVNVEDVSEDASHGAAEDDAAEQPSVVHQTHVR